MVVQVWFARGPTSNLQRKAFQSFVAAKAESAESEAVTADGGGAAAAARTGNAPSARESSAASVHQHVGGKNMFPPFRRIGSGLQMQLHASAVAFVKEQVDDATMLKVDSLISSFLLSERPVTTATAGMNMFPDHFDTDKNFRACLSRVAAGVVEGCGTLWGHLLVSVQGLLQRGWEPLLFLKKRKYDETPLRLRLRCSDSDPSAQGHEKTITKVVKSQFSLSMLLKSPSGVHQLIHGFVPTHLQAIDRGTSECLLACQLDLEDLVPEMRRVADSFQNKIQHTVTDRNAANIKAERALAAADTTWALVHQFCDSHKIAQIQTQTTGMLDLRISGVIALALSMQHAGSTQQLRNALNDIWRERLVVREGPPPEVAKAHRTEVYDLYLGALPELTTDRKYKAARRQRRQQRIVLNHYLNGELRSSEVTHYTLQAKDRRQILQEFQKWVTPMLIPGRCELFPRSRWLKGDLAIDYAGLLASHHSLLGPLVYAAGSQPQLQRQTAQPDVPSGWASLAKSAAMGSLMYASADVGDQPARPEETLARPEADEDRADAIEHPSIQSGLHAENPELVADNSAKDAQTWAAFNKSMKDKARAWAMSHPGVSHAAWRQIAPAQLVLVQSPMGG